MSEIYGLWRGIVVDNADPETSNRVTLRIPVLFGTAETGWAMPCLVPGYSGPPPDAGNGVWVMFEGGNPDRPVWIGTW